MIAAAPPKRSTARNISTEPAPILGSATSSLNPTTWAPRSTQGVAAPRQPPRNCPNRPSRPIKAAERCEGSNGCSGAEADRRVAAEAAVIETDRPLVAVATRVRGARRDLRRAPGHGPARHTRDRAGDRVVRGVVAARARSPVEPRVGVLEGHGAVGPEAVEAGAEGAVGSAAGERARGRAGRRRRNRTDRRSGLIPDVMSDGSGRSVRPFNIAIGIFIAVLV